MNKNQSQVVQRAKDVQKEVAASKNPTQTVRRIAKRLYLSERTIWYDLKRVIIA